mgnify:CR=1 FL=1
MTNDVLIWINEEMDNRGWSQRELARRADLSHGTISKVIAGQTRVTFEFCHAIAQAFGEPPQKLFRLAGLLPPLPSEQDELIEEVVARFTTLSVERRKQVLEYVLFQMQQQDKEAGQDDRSVPGDASTASA